MKLIFMKVSGRWVSVTTTWLGVYPLLTLLAWLLEPVLTDQHLAVRTLIMSVLMVPAMVLLVMPAMQSLRIRMKQ